MLASGTGRRRGSPGTVAAKIDDFLARTQADEIIVAGSTFDPEKRMRSLELTMDAVERAEVA